MPKNLQNVNFIILAEGITEKILLPVFSHAAGLDFISNGIKIISSGGKNRLLRIYKKLSQEVNTPIFMILDADAEELIKSNINIIRSTDHAYVLSKGEFEDILSDGLIVKAINDHYRLMGSITLPEIVGKKPKAQVLSDLYKVKGFGEFKKAEFAQILSGYISDESHLSGELKQLFGVLRDKLTSNPLLNA